LFTSTLLFFFDNKPFIALKSLDGRKRVFVALPVESAAPALSLDFGDPEDPEDLEDLDLELDLEVREVTCSAEVGALGGAFRPPPTLSSDIDGSEERRI